MTHIAHVSGSTQECVQRATAFLREGAEAGERLVALTTVARREPILAAVPGAQWHDAAGFAERFLREGEVRIQAYLDELLGVGAFPAGRLRVYGEAVEVLVRRGAWEEAVQLEAFWSRAARKHGFPLLCSYTPFQGPRDAVAALLACHDRVEGRERASGTE